MAEEIKFEEEGKLNILDTFTIGANSPLALALKDNFEAQQQLIALVQELIDKEEIN